MRSGDTMRSLSLNGPIDRMITVIQRLPRDLKLRQKNYSEGYAVRDNEDRKDAVAAPYLNKTHYDRLVNKDRINVPFGRNPGIAIMASALREVAIRSSALTARAPGEKR